MPAIQPQPDWYAILDVAPGADAAAIKAAHRKRARELHPDINASQDANERMAEVNHARDVLLDPRARALFDRERIRRGATVSTPRVVHREPRHTNARATTTGPIRFTFNHARAGRTVHEEVYEEEPRAAKADWAFDAANPRRHDWYGFLGLPPWATADEVQAAIARRAPEATRASLSPEERMRRGQKLRAAWETLGPARSRQSYDASRPAWRPRRDMPDLYRVVGVRPVASTETIGAAVARHARAIGPKPIGAARERETVIREAWWVLRDPDRRATYDAARAAAATSR
jgi:curved DNA-binding protein CbpA